MAVMWVVIQVPYQQSGYNTLWRGSYEPPKITSISPNVVSTAGGTTITLTGHFGPGAPSTAITVMYGVPTLPSTMYLTNNVAVLDSGTITVQTTAGAGSVVSANYGGYRVTAMVFSNMYISTNDNAAALLSYESPVVTAIGLLSSGNLYPFNQPSVTLYVRGTSLGQSLYAYRWLQYTYGDGSNVVTISNCSSSYLAPQTEVQCTFDNIWYAPPSNALRFRIAYGDILYPNVTTYGGINGNAASNWYTVSSYISWPTSTVTTVQSVSGGNLACTGGDWVQLSGSNLGGNSTVSGASPTAIGATYGPTGVEFTAAQCISVSAITGTAIRCKTVSGYGTDHQWRVNISGMIIMATGGQKTSYAGPNFIGRAAVNPTFLNTDGTSLLTITGTTGHYISFITCSICGSHLPLIYIYLYIGGCFGAVSSDTEYWNSQPTAYLPSIWYGPATDITHYQPPLYTCTITVAQTTMVCNTTQGVGGGVSNLYTLCVAVRGTTICQPQTIGYGAPVLLAGSVFSSTLGGSTMVVSGNSFGRGPAAGDGPVMAYWGPSLEPYRWNSTNCTITQPHVEMTCITTPGTCHCFLAHQLVLTIYLIGIICMATHRLWWPFGHHFDRW